MPAPIVTGTALEAPWACAAVALFDAACRAVVGNAASATRTSENASDSVTTDGRADATGNVAVARGSAGSTGMAAAYGCASAAPFIDLSVDAAAYCCVLMEASAGSVASAPSASASAGCRVGVAEETAGAREAAEASFAADSRSGPANPAAAASTATAHARRVFDNGWCRSKKKAARFMIASLQMLSALASDSSAVTGGGWSGSSQNRLCGANDPGASSPRKSPAGPGGRRLPPLANQLPSCAVRTGTTSASRLFRRVVAA